MFVVFQNGVTCENVASVKMYDGKEYASDNYSKPRIYINDKFAGAYDTMKDCNDEYLMIVAALANGTTNLWVMDKSIISDIEKRMRDIKGI